METMVVSYSDVSSYLRCPRALQLKHAGTPEQDKPVMALGRAMHRLHEVIVAAGWGPEDEEAATTALADLLGQEVIDGQALPEIIATDDKLGKTFAKLAASIPWLLEEVAGRDYLSIEAGLRASLPGAPGVEIAGHPDALYLRDDLVTLGDLKCGRNKPSDVGTDLQLNFYAALVREATGIVPDELEITHPYSREVLSAVCDPGLLDATLAEVVVPAVAGIAAGVWPCNPTHPYGCGGCLYAAACEFGRAAQTDDGGE
jgi:CRISPR/Cas system-associated exonuclease Cas4 (RecB family)